MKTYKISLERSRATTFFAEVEIEAQSNAEARRKAGWILERQAYHSVGVRWEEGDTNWDDGVVVGVEAL